jgi:RNA recognition motif-containing protein
MGTEAEEASAITALDQAEWMGRELKVNPAKPRENNREKRSFNSRGGNGDRRSY